jgi:hypothetical protein
VSEWTSECARVSSCDCDSPFVILGTECVCVCVSVFFFFFVVVVRYKKICLSRERELLEIKGVSADAESF